MSDTIENLSHKIERATELESVVSTMKALAASNIGQYERAVDALANYHRTVTLGLMACLRGKEEIHLTEPHPIYQEVGLVVFGSDQGLVGQFNDSLTEFVMKSVQHFHGHKKVWTVGERMNALMVDQGFEVVKNFEVPHSVHAITSLMEKILSSVNTDVLYVFHNAPTSRAMYQPSRQRLLPLDKKWRHQLSLLKWPNRNQPEILGDEVKTFGALIREYLFVSLFKACAESLASENGSRLVAMQRAEKNINDMMDELKSDFYRIRQNTIDEELFDVLAGFESLSQKKD